MDDGYTATTHMIRVTVHPVYLEDQSDPDENKFVWAYRVHIRNIGQVSVQLLRRTWHITDGRGRMIEVEGPGVIGEQPVIEPSEAFEYTSGTPLETPTGFMRGFYHMVEVNSGEPFDVVIPTFSLDSPHGGNQVH